MKGMDYSLNRMVPIILIITILSPMNFMSAGSPKSGSVEILGEEIVTSRGFEFLLDEGIGQIIHDFSAEDPFIDDHKALNAYLGELPFEDPYDPEWTSNTRNGFALQFFDGDRLTYPADPGIEGGPFTFMISIFPYNVKHERAIFSFEDSDNEVNGLFIVDGYLETRWRGGSNLHCGVEIEPGSWYDIGVIWSPPYEEIYVNGLLIDRQVWEFFIPSVSDLLEINFGVLVDGTGYRYPFLGIMDDISLSGDVRDPGGIIGSWNFQEGPSAGSPQVHDRSGCGNHGTYVNPSDPGDSMILAEGIYGNCIDFSNTEGYIDCGDMKSVTSKNGLNWSISLWLRPNGLIPDRSSNNISNTFLAYSSPSDGDSDPLEIGLDGDHHLSYHLSTGNADPPSNVHGTSSASIPESIWTHLFVSIGEDNGIWSFFVEMDGAERIVDTGPIPGPMIHDVNSSFKFTIGGSIASTPSYFNGRMDEIVLSTSDKNPFPGKKTSVYLFDSDASDKSMFMDRDLQANNIDFSSANVKYGTGSAFFNGHSSFIYHDEPEDFLSGFLSVDFWIYPLSMESDEVLISISDGKGNDTLYFSMDADGYLNLSVFLESDSHKGHSHMNSRYRVRTREWNHVGLSCGNGGISISLNGVIDNSTRKDIDGMRVSKAAGEQVLMIGAAAGIGSKNHYHGFMDGMRISEHPLDLRQDTDGDGMTDGYEIMRSTDSQVFDPLECNGRYALLVGNNDNRSDKNVGFASANDVRDLRYLLRSLGWLDCDFSVLFNKENILGSSYGNLSYVDGTPSRSDVIDGLEWLGDVSGPSDLVMIFYSGHGDQLPDEDGDEDHFDFSSAGKNMSKQDEQLALSNHLDGDPCQLSDDDYTELVLEIKAKQMVHIIISCNSGGFLEDIRQGYEGEAKKPWEMYTLITACHENDVAYVKNRESSFLAQSMFDKAMMKTDRDQWGDRKAFGRSDWDPDIDVTINNMRYIEQDGVSGDNPSKVDDPPHWQRNHYTETGYVPGYENGWEGQDFPDSNFLWGETDRATMYVSMLDYSPSNNNGIIDIEEAFYFSVHNEYLGEGNINPEADPNSSTDLGDDPLIYDSDPVSSSKIYL